MTDQIAPDRRDGSMSLLVDMLRDAQDPSYAAAAARRTADRPRGRAAVGAAVLVAVGLLTGTAVADVRGDSGALGQTRVRLVQQVTDRTTESDALARESERLRAEVAASRDVALARGAQGRAAAARLGALEMAAAAVPVVGPGVVVTLDDRPNDGPDDGPDDTPDDGPDDGPDVPALPRGAQPGDARVLDRDLQALVNGLWAAGAEAVSVNDLRLTVRTAIRSAGEAILVDLRPISPPYVVRAIGEPGRLEPAFADGPAGRRLATYTSLYGLRLDIDSSAGLRLPAGTVAALEAAG